VYVEGRIQTNEWEDNDGNTRYTTEIVARNVQFLSGGDGGGGFSGGGGGRHDQSRPEVEDDFDQSFDDEDIPF
ncbi:MAG: single-stranded DNA-binding protein, partial [Persicimonas sp.]